jgi:ParB family transcriptional regulator, chromosome partitioning protein
MEKNRMPSTTHAAATADKAGDKTAAEKVHDKVVEKRRALGRGLDSLLPGPRVVTVAAAAAPPATAAPATPAQVERTDDNDPIHRKVREEWGTHQTTSQPEPSRSEPGIDEGVGVLIPAAPLRVTTISGLQAASEDGAGDSSTSEEVVRLALDLIDENPHQTRRTFHEDTLRELGESIRVQGVLQPIVVRECGEGRFRLILGERRVRASRLAGIETIPAIVKRVSEQQAAEMTLVENLQRQDLNCIEQAEAFARLSTEFHLTQEQIGARVGMSRETVSNYMRLLSLPEGVLGAIISGKLTFSHARVMLQMKTTDHVALWYYAKKAIDHGMSVKRFEDFVAGKFNPPADGPPMEKRPDVGGGARWVDPNVKAAQRSLEEVLGMRVRIRDRAGRGKIVIEYATIDDFQRVVGMLRGE